MRILLAAALAAASCMGQIPGVWRMNAARSTFAGSARPKALTMRIDNHPAGEVLTLDTVAEDGRATTFSTILYFDGKPRDFHDFSCSGTQKSRRLDARAVEIVRECDGGRQVRLLRRNVEPGRLIFEITEQNPEGRRTLRRLVLERD
jgi:hypothetical protein